MNDEQDQPMTHPPDVDHGGITRQTESHAGGGVPTGGGWR
jgi:hypothetical protein